MRFEQAETEVFDRRALDVFGEVPLHVAGLQQADVRAVALDGADTGERGDEWLVHARANEEARLLEVREVLGPQLEWCVQDLRAELGAVLLLPCLPARHTEMRAR